MTTIKNEMRTPQQMLLHWEREAPDYIVFNQPIDRKFHEFSWRDAVAQARRIANGLHDLGLQPGDRVAILSKNCAEWFIADFAIMLGGFVSVPVYSTANADTLGYVLRHSECRALFAGKLDATANLAEAVPAECPIIGFPYPGGLESQHHWADWLTQHAPLTAVHVPLLDDVMTILYTSGSTGKPKGAVHTYRSYAHAGTNLGTMLGCGPDMRCLSYLPLAHCTERAYVEAALLYHNTHIWFSESLETFFDDLRIARPVAFGSVPRLWKRFQLGVLEKMPARKLDVLRRLPIIRGIVGRKIRASLGLDGAKWLGGGAAPMSPAMLEWWDSLGMPINEGWGMTETFACGTSTAIGKQPRIGTIGKPQTGVEIRISDEGEILIRCDSLMREYYKEPEQTAEAFVDGFLRTGDRGEIDADGYVRITGRAKEIFKTAKGKYVAPAPIEALLSQNRWLEQVCIVGLGLTQPVALLQLAPGATDHATVKADLEATLAQVNNSLESHERLHALIVVKDEWTPENGIMTPTQKIKRHEVEKRYRALCENAERGVSWES